MDPSIPLENPNITSKLSFPKYNSSIQLSSNYKDFLEILENSNSLQRSSSASNYSKYKCLGRQNIINANEGRSCIFKNICYNIPSKQYYFYQPIKKPVFYDYRKGPLFTFPERFISLNALHIFHSGLYFSPNVVQDSLPLNDSHFVDNLHVIWSSWATDYNFGHLVYEELGNSYIDLLRFGIDIPNKNIQMLNYRPAVKNDAYHALISFFGKIFSTKDFILHDEYFNSNSKLWTKSNVCFSELMVASSTRLFLDFQDVTNEGKEPLWKKFRDDVLKYNQLDPNFKPKKPRITFLKKVKSAHAKTGSQRNHFRDIYNIEELVEFTTIKYPNAIVEIIDPSILSLKDQLLKMQETTILVTPSGGISMIAPFLPENSHAIIMDYYVSKHPIYNSFIPYSVGDSGSMEISFWNLFPHITKHYYQIMDPQIDQVWDTNSSNSRDDASIKVLITRFEFLLDQATWDMN